MYKPYIITFLISLLSLSSYPANSVSEADSAYMAGNYTSAIELYNNIVEQEGTSASLLYNLGNAYMKSDDYGMAMLCYQRAKKLDPSNRLINSNLSYLKEKIEDANKAEQKGKKKKVSEDTANFFQSIHSMIAEEHSSDSWAGWAAAFFLIFSGCGALYLFSQNVMLRKFGFFGGMIFLGICIVFLVCAYTAGAAFQQREYGIITSFKTDLRTEPDNDPDEKNIEGTLTRGTKIRIISEEVDSEGQVTWYKVRLNSDYIGWLEANEIEII